MGDFYSHDDYDDTPERRAYLARSGADDLCHEQQQRTNYIKWIDDLLETMDEDQLRLMYDVSSDVEEYKTFFKVLKKLK